MATKATQQGEVVEFSIKVPTGAIEMLTAAAELQGWQAVINDKPNPTSAFEFLRNNWFEQIRAQATQRVAQKRQAVVYEETNAEVGLLLDEMRKANG